MTLFQSRHFNITPVLEKCDRSSEISYRLVNIPSNIWYLKDVFTYTCQTFSIKYYPSTSVVLEKVLFNSQQNLVSLIEKRREASDNGGCFGVLLTDLFLYNIFDYLLHDWSMAKLHARGFDLKALKLVSSHLDD